MSFLSCVLKVLWILKFPLCLKVFFLAKTAVKFFAHQYNFNYLLCWHGWMDGWMRTSVLGSDPSLRIIHWPLIPPRSHWVQRFGQRWDQMGSSKKLEQLPRNWSNCSATPFQKVEIVQMQHWQNVEKVRVVLIARQKIRSSASGFRLNRCWQQMACMPCRHLKLDCH